MLNLSSYLHHGMVTHFVTHLKYLQRSLASLTDITYCVTGMRCADERIEESYREL